MGFGCEIICDEGERVYSMKWLKRIACVFGYHDLHRAHYCFDITVAECKRCGAWPYHVR